MNTLLLINLIVILFKIPITELYPDYTYLIWDVSLLFHSISAFYLIGKLLPKSGLINRMINFSLLIISSYTLINYIVRAIAEYNGGFIVTNYTCFLIFLGIILPLVIKMFLPLSKSKDKYNTKDCFMIYKRGTSKIGMMFGHSSIICKGVKYYYKKGELTKVKFRYNKDCIYEKINKIDISKLNNLLGCKWSILNNCYDLKNRIEKND